MKHIAVIGAGITGVTTTYSLLQRGFDVTLFDHHRYAAMQTSFANGGQLSASNAEVWNQTSTILKGIAWMLKRDAPLLVNPRPGWHKLSWMAEFMREIPNYERNTVTTVRLALAAREHLKSWAQKENISFDYESRGILHVYTDQKSYDHATRVTALLARGGLIREALTEAEMKELEPALSGSYVGGYFTPSDASGDIHRYSRGLAEACKRLGAEFCFDTSVEKLLHTGKGVRIRDTRGNEHDADGVVICAGIRSRALAAQLGDRVNVYPVKGYSVTIPLRNEASRRAAPWVSLLDDGAKIVLSRLGEERLRIAGTAEFNGNNLDIRDDRVRPLVEWCRRHFPDVETDEIVPWAGLRPMMPDMLPRVGPGSKAGVYYNTGHGHLGWTLAPATADLIAANIASREPMPALHRVAEKVITEAA